MLALEHDREIAALTPLVTGTTLELPGVSPGLLPGTTYLSRPWKGGCHDFSKFADKSVDAIVAVGPIEGVDDWIAELTQWRRVLVSGGRVGWATTSAPQGMLSMMVHFGGFEQCQIEQLDDEGKSFVLTAQRSELAEIRQPLGAIGSRLGELATQDAHLRAELYFQLGSILLQAGDPNLGRKCFEHLMEIEGDSGDGLFGLGMCAGSLGAWDEALGHLVGARECDPDNEEVQRWIALAEAQLAAVAQAAQNAPSGEMQDA